MRQYEELVSGKTGPQTNSHLPSIIGYQHGQSRLLIVVDWDSLQADLNSVLLADADPLVSANGLPLGKYIDVISAAPPGEDGAALN